MTLNYKDRSPYIRPRKMNVIHPDRGENCIPRILVAARSTCPDRLGQFDFQRVASRDYAKPTSRRCERVTQKTFISFATPDMTEVVECPWRLSQFLASS